VADVGSEDFSGGRAFKGHAGGFAIAADGGDHGRGVPLSAGGMVMESLSYGGSPPEPGHVGFGARFVEEDESVDVEFSLILFPLATGDFYVGSVLLAGAQRFFYSSVPSSPVRSEWLGSCSPTSVRL